MANKRITDVDTIESLNSNESFFVNQNNSIKQINKGNIVFGFANGGTDATTPEGARANLNVYSKSEVDALMNSNTMTIPVDAWRQNETYGDLYYANMDSVPYVNDNSIIFITPAEYPVDNFNAYIENKVRACEQGFETIGFIADAKPETDIVINYSVFA